MTDAWLRQPNWKEFSSNTLGIFVFFKNVISRVSIAETPSTFTVCPKRSDGSVNVEGVEIILGYRPKEKCDWISLNLIAFFCLSFLYVWNPLAPFNIIELMRSALNNIYYFQ